MARRLWRERYEALVTSGELAAEWDEDRMAPRSCAALHADDGRDGFGRSRETTASADSSAAARRRDVEATQSEAIREWLDGVVRIARARIPAASRGLWLGNLAELVAAEHVGVAHVAALLRAMEACRR